MFDLVDDQPLSIRFTVPEIYAGEIEVGDQVEFRVRSDTVATRIAAVDYVSPDFARQPHVRDHGRVHEPGPGRQAGSVRRPDGDYGRP